MVLVHGLIVSGRYMLPTLERLAPRYRVYAPDLPGFGRSEKPPRALDVAELADSLAGWLGATGLEGADLVANSFGCQISTHLLARSPELVRRLVIVGPTMDPSARSAPRQISRFLRNALAEPPAVGGIELHDYWRAGFGRGLGTFRHALNDRIEARLPLVRVPTLVVRGSRDPICPQGWAEEAARLLPDGRLAVVPGAAHTVNYGAAGDLARLVRTFLDADDAAGTRISR